ncbi:thiolase family protein [Maritimibacter sp. DP07]|uniref:Thiolase family protein n=1 Tax=Maritimibacter harenae TaxID=2606218 RepID=A0A845M4U2_9RHOB|nr:thiolase family protein [Maritimibacter harenae]MZR13418.1 thiolase family protein [Maritimibacter harenae]
MGAAYISGVGLTAFGRHEGLDSLDLMTRAAGQALDDASVKRADVDGLVTGYSTAMPHLMMATRFCEHFGLDPAYAVSLQLGGATGAGMVMHAKLLVEAGRYRNVLVVAGENRLTNEGGRDQAIKTLAQVGHADHEVPFGATVPGYYALLASHYLAHSGATREELAHIAAYMRRHGGMTEGAHVPDPITVEEAMDTRVIADPLRLADCCPISDGAAALLISAKPSAQGAVRLAGAGQAHRHQHVTAIKDWSGFGAREAADRAFAEAKITRPDVGILGIYDSFTVTFAILLEACGFAAPGTAGRQIAEGAHDDDGLPINTHGGLLSYGHCGVAGGMAHLVETTRQLQGRAGDRQVRNAPEVGYVHADGGVLSAHVGLVLRADQGAR